VLDGLFVTPAVTAIREALAAISGEHKLAVIGDAKLAAALAETHEVLPVGMPPRAAKKVANALADLSSVEDRSLGAIVGVGVAVVDDWQHTLATWARRVRDGGVIVLVDRGHAPEASRRTLCAGLTEIAQRHAGRIVVTSGVVTHL
jgi:hypothetical protein